MSHPGQLLNTAELLLLSWESEAVIQLLVIISLSRIGKPVFNFYCYLQTQIVNQEIKLMSLLLSSCQYLIKIFSVMNHNSKNS